MKNSSGVGTVVAVVLFALATTAGAQEKPASGPSEGIAVHGHWTIEVRNPDGTLVSHVEFENNLAPPGVGQDGGAQFLSKILARASTVGSWTVVAVTSVRCGSYAFSCFLDEFSPVQPGLGRLTVSAPSSGVDAGKFVLTGNVEAGGDVAIFQVSTSPNTCLSTVAPANCGQNGTQSNLTIHAPGGTLASATTGQIITVKVVISFS